MLDLEPIRARIVALARWDACHRKDDADDEANAHDERVFRIWAPGDIAALIEEVERLRAELSVVRAELESVVVERDDAWDRLGELDIDL